ncbi:mitochondrial sodium/calcium exchanger protein-like [Malaya genurostris]|uniref:mitochondrial sodium/calcium exchanger protein-like n=1 Tax=Malaya genurostris TaxID=325434 RepID=UPI0026F3F1A3|nr:mitochondrial sodium/calcium exchanger protein-like [Malaya genurostris]
MLYVSKSLHLNEYVAGVTILTICNGISEIAANFRQTGSIDTELIYNQYLGTSLFEMAFIGALIVLRRRFYVFPEFFLPSIITLIGASTLLQILMHQEQISFAQNLILLAIYIVYLIAIMLTSIIVRSQIEQSSSKSLERAVMLSMELEIRTRDGRSVDIEATQAAGFVGTHPNQQLLAQFVNRLRPFLWQELEVSNGWMRSAKLFVAPVQTLITLLVPKVNYELPMHGWSKLMFVVNVVLFPLFCVLVISGTDYSYHKMELVFATSVMTAVLVFLVTRTDRKPPGYIGIALFALFGTVFVSLLIVFEIGAMLGTLAVVMNISKTSLGITLLPWANCWIDVNTSLELTRRGVSKIGFAACLAGPLFNILIALFIVFSTRMIQFESLTIEVREGASGPTCSAYLVITSVLILLTLVFSKFQARACLGFMLFFTYGMFLLNTVLSELEIIHAYGTDHNADDND